MSSYKRTNISWPDVVFYAEAQREPFADVRVVTLYSHCLSISEEQGIPLEEVEACEFIKVHPDRVEVVIDADTVDDETIANALDMMTNIDNFKVGTYKEFPPLKSFKYKKVH